MKHCKEIIIKTLLCLTLLLGLSGTSFAQGKLYTRKARLEDFPARTVKVVTSGNSILESTFREEITSRWRLSPYEFCTEEEYGKLNKDNNLYFIRLAQDSGVAFIILSKGGKDDEQDNLKKPFEIVRVPIANTESLFFARKPVFMGAFIDIIQDFTERAMASDQAAYAELNVYNSEKMPEGTLILSGEQAEQAYLEGRSGTAAAVVITPESPESGEYCYKMIIDCCTHQLLYYKKARFKSAQDAEFKASEIKQIEKRNGVFSR